MGFNSAFKGLNGIMGASFGHMGYTVNQNLVGFGSSDTDTHTHTHTHTHPHAKP
jgi:hypothetical protein